MGVGAVLMAVAVAVVVVVAMVLVAVMAVAQRLAVWLAGTGAFPFA